MRMGVTCIRAPGDRSETGSGAAAGLKLNIPLAPGADDAVFFAAWTEVEAYLERGQPELIVLQCGADSLAGDPITHLQYTEQAHAHAASRLSAAALRWGTRRSWRWAAVATTAAIWHVPGPGWWKHLPGPGRSAPGLSAALQCRLPPAPAAPTPSELCMFTAEHTIKGFDDELFFRRWKPNVGVRKSTSS